MTLSHATTLPKMMNGTQYMQWYNLARKLDNNGVDNPYFTDEEIAATYNGDPTDGFENTDWTSDLYKTTLMHQHNLSINGGSNKVRYFISGGYLHQDGIIKGNKNERSNFRSNIDVQATKDIKVSLNTAALIKDYYQPGGTLMAINKPIVFSISCFTLYLLFRKSMKVILLRHTEAQPAQPIRSMDLQIQDSRNLAESE